MVRLIAFRITSIFPAQDQHSGPCSVACLTRSSVRELAPVSHLLSNHGLWRLAQISCSIAATQHDKPSGFLAQTMAAKALRHDAPIRVINWLPLALLTLAEEFAGLAHHANVLDVMWCGNRKAVISNTKLLTLLLAARIGYCFTAF